MDEVLSEWPFLGEMLADRVDATFQAGRAWMNNSGLKSHGRTGRIQMLGSLFRTNGYILLHSRRKVRL